MSKQCPVCGLFGWDGRSGHPWNGKRTPPKTRWCTGAADSVSHPPLEQPEPAKPTCDHRNELRDECDLCEKKPEVAAPSGESLPVFHFTREEFVLVVEAVLALKAAREHWLIQTHSPELRALEQERLNKCKALYDKLMGEKKCA